MRVQLITLVTISMVVLVSAHQPTDPVIELAKQAVTETQGLELDSLAEEFLEVLTTILDTLENNTMGLALYP